MMSVYLVINISESEKFQMYTYLYCGCKSEGISQDTHMAIDHRSRRLIDFH